MYVISPKVRKTGSLKDRKEMKFFSFPVVIKISKTRKPILSTSRTNFRTFGLSDFRTFGLSPIFANYDSY